MQIKTPLRFLLPIVCAISVQAAEPVTLAEDDASNASYNGGWKSEGGGSGFADWTFQTQKAAEGEAYAGYFIATKEQNGDLNGIATQGKAFGLFANGTGFEAAAAFRPLKKPLESGQTFSFLIENGEFKQKFDGDPGGGSGGITLRPGNACESVEDYNKAARFEFGAYADQKNYQIYDGESDHDTGVPLTDAGLSVSVTLVTADTCDVEITALADKKKTTLKGRKLGGEAGSPIESFCIFNRNSEQNDVFFNGFQILGAAK